MTERLTAIRHRRNALVAQAEAQRQALDRLVQPWRSRLALADSAIVLASELRKHCITIAAGTALFTWIGRGRLGVWIGRIWMGWRVYRSLRHPGPHDQS